MLFFYPRRGLPSSLFPSVFPTKILHAFPFPLLRATRTTHLNLYDLIMQTIFGEYTNTWCIQVLRSPNLLKKKDSSYEAENALISQGNHPVDVHIFHNADATIAWPQHTFL